MITLISGGARSGKSSLASTLLENSEDVVYIATSKIYDDETRERVEMHKKDRPDYWRTFENSDILTDAIGPETNYILDCITVLTFNKLFDVAGDSLLVNSAMQKVIEDKTLSSIFELMEKCKASNYNLIMITNEVGDSIVPDNPLSRSYRDILGRINQKIAAKADSVYMTFCGIPLKIK